MKIYSEGARALSENIIKNIPICNSTGGISCCFSVRLHFVCCSAGNAWHGTVFNELFKELNWFLKERRLGSGQLVSASSVRISLAPIFNQKMELLPNKTVLRSTQDLIAMVWYILISALLSIWMLPLLPTVFVLQWQFSVEQVPFRQEHSL